MLVNDYAHKIESGKTDGTMQNVDDPIEILMKEHEEGLKYLKRLGDAAEHIKTYGFSFDAFEDIAEAIRFIDTEIRHHNEREEKYLFPLMDTHATSPSKVIRDEHRELWRAFNNLMESVKNVEELRIYPTTVMELIQNSKAIVELLSNHIAKENEILFPMTKQLLTKEEYEQLGKNIAKDTLRLQRESSR